MSCPHWIHAPILASARAEILMENTPKMKVVEPMAGISGGISSTILIGVPVRVIETLWTRRVDGVK